MKRFKLAFTENPVFQTVTGLTNKTWSGTPTTGRAATEDQLAALATIETALWSGSVVTDAARTFTLSKADTDFDEILIVGYGSGAMSVTAPNVLAIYRPALMTQGGDYIPLKVLYIVKDGTSLVGGHVIIGIMRTNATTLTYNVMGGNQPVTIIKIIGRKYYLSVG